MSDLPGLTTARTVETSSSSVKGLRRTRTEPCVRSASALAPGSFLPTISTTGIFEVFGEKALSKGKAFTPGAAPAGARTRERPRRLLK